MTEAQIIEFIYRAKEVILAALQWWVSVSFALLAFAHLGRNQLNWIIVTVALALYVAFSAYTSAILNDQFNSIFYLTRDLAALPGADAGASNMSDFLVASVSSLEAGAPALRIYFFGMLFAIYGTFFATIGYVIYVFLASRRLRKR